MDTGAASPVPVSTPERLVITALLASAAGRPPDRIARADRLSGPPGRIAGPEPRDRGYFSQPTEVMTVSARLPAPKLARPLRTATMLGRW